MQMKSRLSHTTVACLLSTLIAAACSTQPARSNPKPMYPLMGASKEMAFEECFAVGAWTDREACFAASDDQTIDRCEAMHPQSCRPYKAMHLATQRVHALEDEIQTASKSTYADYVVNDPEYLKDLVSFLRQSVESWGSYRDAHCQLESHLAGMSRTASADVVEQCRLEKTRERELELEALLKLLKSNKEQ